MTQSETNARADFGAGRKDELAYATSEPYRLGWQQARREFEIAEERAAGGRIIEALPRLFPGATGGTFEISNGEKSATLAHDATQADLDRALQEVCGVPAKPDLPVVMIPPEEIAAGYAAAREPEPLVLERPPAVLPSTRPEYRVPSMAEIAARPKNGFKCVSTFSGCGGSSLGYKMAGFDVLWANEFIPAAQETYRANHPGTILDVRDIRTVTAEEILAATGLKVGEIDLFDGSPPCASFSTAGIREAGWGREKKYSDTVQRTDDLFFEYARLIKGTQPKVFVAENVAGLTVGVAKEMLGEGQIDAFETQEDTILHTLMDCGYRVGFHVLNAMDVGVPQSRRRVIFVGIRKDIADATGLEPAWPRPLGYVHTIRDACPWIAAASYNNKGRNKYPEETREITDAPAPTITVGCADERGGGVRNHFIVEAETDIARFAIGREWEKLKPGEQSEKYFSLIRTHPDEPCPCVCASHGSGGIASITHPTERRKFSIAELKRLCGFPDDFVLTGTYQQQWERLGRAVPPLMMAAVAATVRDEILAKIPPPKTIIVPVVISPVAVFHEVASEIPVLASVVKCEPELIVAAVEPGAQMSLFP